MKRKMSYIQLLEEEVEYLTIILADEVPDTKLYIQLARMRFHIIRYLHQLYDQEEELKRHDKKGVRTIDLYDISVTPTDITSKFSLQAGSM